MKHLIWSAATILRLKNPPYLFNRLFRAVILSRDLREGNFRRSKDAQHVRGESYDSPAPDPLAGQLCSLSLNRTSSCSATARRGSGGPGSVNQYRGTSSEGTSWHF